MFSAQNVRQNFKKICGPYYLDSKQLNKLIFVGSGKVYVVDDFDPQLAEPPKFKHLLLDAKFIDLAVHKKNLLLLNGKFLI